MAHPILCRNQKHCHETKASAIESAEKVDRRFGLTLYVYRCSYCQSWHLTKRAPKQHRK